MNIIEEILRRYPDQSSKKIAEELGLSINFVYNVAHKHKVKKSEAFKNSPESGMFRKGVNNSARTQFKKGHVPHNKGKKMPAEVYEKAKRTFFKPGQVPHNKKQENHITIRSDKSGAEYKYIKVGYNDWQLYHRYIWQQANGPIPEGYILVFKDRNSLNCTLENIELITYDENMRRNTIQRYPAPLKQVMKLTKKLIKKINGKEQNQ
jgi:hypothetical protein